MRKLWIFSVNRLLMIGTIFAIAWGGGGSENDERIEQIDRQIKELSDMKRGYEARAIRAEDQANRLQFEDHFVLETRRYYRIADENRAKAAKVQEEIDRLEAEKAAMIKKSSKRDE